MVHVQVHVNLPIKQGCRENFQTYTYDEGGGGLRAAGEENLT